MAERFIITIPYHQDLKKTDGWTAYPQADHKYFVARCHYLLRSRQLPDSVRMGEVIDAYTTAPGVGMDCIPKMRH